MSTGPGPEDWFATNRFRTDVVSYGDHQRLSVLNMSRQLDINYQQLKRFFDGHELTLRIAAALARVCDLDLDSYVLSMDAHYLVSDERYRPDPEPQPTVEPQQVMHVVEWGTGLVGKLRPNPFQQRRKQ